MFHIRSSHDRRRFICLNYGNIGREQFVKVSDARIFFIIWELEIHCVFRPKWPHCPSQDKNICISRETQIAPKFSLSLHQHLPRACSSPCGQCWNMECLYPISEKKWNLSFGINRAAAILWIGASPHRYPRTLRTQGWLDYTNTLTS